MFIRYIVLSLIVLFPFNIAYADKTTKGKTDWYVGPYAYRMNVDAGQKGNSTIPTKYKGAGITAGVIPFHKVFNIVDIGFEASYQKGGSKNSTSANVCVYSYCTYGVTELDFRLWNINVITSIPISKNGISAFGTLGTGTMNYKVKRTIFHNNKAVASANINGSKTTPSIGLGIEYRPSGSNFSLRAQSKWRRQDGKSAQVILMGINYHF